MNTSTKITRTDIHTDIHIAPQTNTHAAKFSASKFAEVLLCGLASVALMALMASPSHAKKPKVKKAALSTAATAAAVPMFLPPAAPEQLQAAQAVHLGNYACEFNKTLSVQPDAQNAGYFRTSFGNKTWQMKPVQSSTGALRLEDVQGNTLLLQIAFKSMLMDSKAGSRLADGCVSPAQAQEKIDYDRAKAAAQNATPIKSEPN